MGGSNSTPKSDAMMDHQPYPDMNVIFKSIPKMMQVVVIFDIIIYIGIPFLIQLFKLAKIQRSIL